MGSGTKKVPGDGRVYFLGFTATVNGEEDCEYSDVNVGVPHDRKDDSDTDADPDGRISE